MITFALTSDNPNNVGDNLHINDIFMTNGQLGVVKNVYSASQSIGNAIKLWLGEYDYNTSVGIPYQIIFNSYGNNQALIEYQIRNAILSYNNYLTPTQLPIYGINKIKSLTYNINQNTGLFTLNAVIIMNKLNTTIEVNI